MNIKNMKKDAIVLIPWNKKQIIFNFSKEGIHQFKFMTTSEFKKLFYFDYDKKTIFYLMKKYHYQYDVAVMYIEKMYDCLESKINHPKILEILKIKEDLDKENLLIYHNYFRKFVASKPIYLYGFKELSKTEAKLVEELKKITLVEIIQPNEQKYLHKFMYQFSTIADEVHYIASSISSLVLEGIDINKIKICGVDSEYESIIERIFPWYHLPIKKHQTTLYACNMGRCFLEHLSSNIEDTFTYLKENFDLSKQNVLEVYNKLIDIVNDYTWIDDKLLIRDFLINDLKKTEVENIHLKNCIEFISHLTDLEDDVYVFLVGFNQGKIPLVYKDDDYFNDTLRKKLDLDTADMKNRLEANRWLFEIESVKNLTITCRKNSPMGECYVSSLNDNLGLKIKTCDKNYHRSHLANKLELASQLDIYMKYNEITDGLYDLYQTYPTIAYQTYQNNFSGISTSKLKKYLNGKFNLSYSAMNSYYQCGFRYYLSNVLRLNVFEETFYTILGNLFHYILSIYFKKEIDLEWEYDNYIKKCSYPFNARELYFLEKLKKDLKFIIDVILKQNQYNSLVHSYFEEKIEVDKSRNDYQVIFKGFIDKMMINDSLNHLAIIDYKTGNPNLNLNDVIYGLDLQLPVYIYLARKKFPDSRINGFYLQKILNNEIIRDFKHTYTNLKEEKLKLQGYSNNDEELISEFDSGYQDSSVIKGMRTTSRGLGTKRVLSDDSIEKLCNLTEVKIDEAVNSIIEAKFDINPKRIGNINQGCLYCKFLDICFRKEDNIVSLKEHKNLDFLEEETNF